MCLHGLWCMCIFYAIVIVPCVCACECVYMYVYAMWYAKINKIQWKHQKIEENAQLRKMEHVRRLPMLVSNVFVRTWDSYNIPYDACKCEGTAFKASLHTLWYCSSYTPFAVFSLWRLTCIAMVGGDVGVVVAYMLGKHFLFFFCHSIRKNTQCNNIS